MHLPTHGQQAHRFPQLPTSAGHGAPVWLCPRYRALGALKRTFPSVPLLACTATATPMVRRDIIESLGLERPQVVVRTFDRPNLTYAAALR